MELLDVFWRTTNSQVANNVLHQKDGVAIRSSLSLTVSNICMEHFRKLALDSSQQKPSPWLRYVDGTLWSGLMSNILCPAIHLTMEIDSMIPFLDVLVIRKEKTLTTQVYRNPTHFGPYLNFNSA
jgi:hypothetical protein